MTMLTDILKTKGIFSNEIKARFKNKQILLNGEPLSEDIHVGVDINNDDIVDIGDFVFELIKNRNWVSQLMIFGVETLASSNIENDLTNHIKNFMIIRVSKKDAFVIKKKNENVS